MKDIEWRPSKDMNNYITCSADDLSNFGFHYRGYSNTTDTWSYYHNNERTIINRELRIKRKYQKARRLYGNIYYKNGIQISYNIKRTK